MRIIHYLKNTLLLILVATLLTACGGGNSSTSNIAQAPVVETPTTETPTIETPTTEIQINKVIQQGYVTDKETGIPLENVQVSIENTRTITDVKGYYTLNNITQKDEVTVNFKKENYLFSSVKIQLKSTLENNITSPNYIECTLQKYTDNWSFNSEDGTRGGSVEIPPSTYSTLLGETYTGTVNASWIFNDTTTENGRNAFPGLFQGKDTNDILVPFISFGFFSVELKSENGEKLQLSNNITIILRSIQNPIETTLPLWYYDYDKGQWIEEGYAELQNDGSYRMEITHSGTWSLSKPIEKELGIYRGRIVDRNGIAISNVRVNAIGNNWIQHDLSTDKNGVFEIHVIPDASFNLVAYNYKDKYSAKYNNTIPAIASGDIVEE